MKRKRINVTETYLPSKEEYESVIGELWETKWLTNRGSIVLNLEKKLQNYLGTETTPLLVSNGTLALQIPIKALQLSGEVITTPFSYVATTSAIVWENCTPVFVDINPEFLTIDENKIEAAITKNTTAIVAVHVFGNPCAVEKIEVIARKYDLTVIYDAAHCFGVKYRDKSIFDYGDFSTTSFHATKLFHTGEGGAIFCNDKSSTDLIYNHHNFGHDGPLAFHGLGINAKMSELNAAMGMALLPNMDYVIGERKMISEHYDRNLNWNTIRKPKLRDGVEYNYAYYPIIFENEKQLIKTQNALNEANIFPRRYFYPSLNSLPYVAPIDMPVSDNVSETILCLPLFVGLDSKSLNWISELINNSVD
jgi:dTDP-4-amino-4,6-dideoxygalactose transaminase